MLAYYYDEESTEPFTSDHNSGMETPLEELAKIGVIYKKLDTVDQVDQVAKERDYKNRDQIELSVKTFNNSIENLNAKLDVFFKEHLHEDEEIRYILDGEGFFDVRDQNDKWIRTKCFKGDLLILPAGIYHRFTLSDKLFVRALRLFKDEPKWIALNRPVDENAYRQEYLNSIKA
ncbi:hypothetical protein BVG19_g3694 [[Candida] boidinii]|nr:hypothetical protein BVG19_g3694 [[Candida] boidinii]OWB52498.1 hypothetical protein B5S27_g4074 [[Candida] boidinii]